MKENEIIIKQNEDFMECLAIVETKTEGLEREVATERESKEALQADLDKLIEEHVTETDKIVWEFQDQVDDTIKEHILVFEEFKEKTT